MKRKEKVHNALKSLCDKMAAEEFFKGFQGFTTEELAAYVNIERNNVSKELNVLINEMKVVKITGRPVFYLDKEYLENSLSLQLNESIYQSIDALLALKNKSKDVFIANPFSHMIGYNDSLKNQIKKLEAAVIYPPDGLHILLVGPTGVGKSTLAEFMYKYAVATKVISENASFVVFNCADYAENPQLLMAQLFGYVKGAFTGADSDKDGLIDKVNGGYLFLDEIHRLSPEGQEMLFTVIDKKLYRRLGEIELKRKANVRIIGATTKDLNSSLLETFVRRIPIIVELPPLEQRSLPERYEMVRQFISNEAKRINVDIATDAEVIKAMLLYNCQGNIGQLKSDIQLICARGYLEYKTQNRKRVEMTMALLPDYIFSGFFDSKKRNEIESTIELSDKKEIIFSKSLDTCINIEDKYSISQKIYGEINTKLVEYAEKGYSKDIINKALDKHIQKYINELEKKFNYRCQSVQNEEHFRFIKPNVYHAVEYSLKLAEKSLERSFASRVYVSLSMHISELIANYGSKRYENLEDIKSIVLNYPKEYEAAGIIRDELERELRIIISEEEVIFITMFLYAVNKENSYDSNKIGILIICHGENTATSIANVANKLLSTNICNAIDMPLDRNVEDTLKEAIDIVRKIDRKMGVLLMIDMGALATFPEIITEKTGIKTKCVEMVSTPLVLEAIRKCLFFDIDLDSLGEELKTITPYTERSAALRQGYKLENRRKKYILVTCMTGVGTAKKLVSIIRNMKFVKNHKIEVININKNEYEHKSDFFEGQVLAVAGTVDLNISDAVYIPTEQIITQEGMNKFELLLKNTDPYILGSLNSSLGVTLLKALEETLVFLNPAKVYQCISSAYKLIASELDIQGSESLETRFMIHCCCMIERLIRNDSIYHHDANTTINENKLLYNILRYNLKNTEEVFGVSIPDTEICYVIDMINTV
ncbi:MAG: hypothetical protein APF77_03240 [Clostridia bacterium BRH_c25]|nr:MAG: hypothetical protein APF77_03240 [Clostridia bacterium BRH_c25]